MIGLTPRQTDLLRFIVGFQAARSGISPTVRECMRGIGVVSTENVCRMLNGLEERGAIRRLRYRNRAIQVLAPVPVPSINGVPLYAVPLIATGSTEFSRERL